MHIPRVAAILLILTSSALAADADLKDRALRQRWLASMKDFNIPGAVVVAVRGDQVVLVQPLGLRDVENDQPVTPDTIFYIASCTKSFMAMVVMSLAEEGKLELDAPVKKYLPQFQFADAELSESMTIRDLLCHRWGLGSDHITFAEAYSGLITDEMFYRLLKNEHARGSFQYTNLHYTTLGRVVEKVTGMTWKDFLAERIFKPAGMKNTTAYASKMYGSADAALPYAFVFGQKPQPAPLRKTDRTMHAAGGMGTSGNDVARWLILNLNDGQIDGTRIVSEKSSQAMQTLASPQRSTRQILSQHARLGYGLGWVVSEYRGHKMIGHNGGYIGAAAHISFLPDDNIGVAVFANTDGPAGGWVDILAAEVYDKMLDVKDAEDVMAKFKRAIDESPARERAPTIATGMNPAKAEKGLSLEAQAYAGTYVHPTLGEAVVSIEKGVLTVALGDIRPPIISESPDRFKPTVSGVVLRAGSFEVTDNRVIALLITFEDGEEARFERGNARDR